MDWMLMDVDGDSLVSVTFDVIGGVNKMILFEAATCDQVLRSESCNSYSCWLFDAIGSRMFNACRDPCKLLIRSSCR